MGMVFYITKQILVSIFIGLTKNDNLNLPFVQIICQYLNFAKIPDIK